MLCHVYFLCYQLTLVHIIIHTVLSVIVFFFFKQKTAYEMRISDWSSDVCSSDLLRERRRRRRFARSGCRPRRNRGSSPVPSPAKIGRASCRERVCQYV